MHTQNGEIIYLHRKLHHFHEKQQKKKFLHSISKQERDKIISFWRAIIVRGHHDEQAIHTTYVVRQILTEFSASDHYLQNIDMTEINAIADFMIKTKRFEDCANIIDILYLERGVHVFKEAEKLFKTLVQNFEHFENDQVREMVTQNLVQLMRENKKHQAFANHPYYFMEYLLHLINQEEDPARVYNWFDIIQSLYIHPDSEKHLFYENDFRILVDILVRHIENYNSEHDLIKFIECYLVFSIVPFIVKNNRYYKLQQIIIVVNDVPNPNEALKGYGEELRALQLERP